MLRNRAALRTASEQKVTGYASATNGKHDYYAALEKVEKKGCSGRIKKEKIKHLAQQQHALVSSLTYPGRLCESLLLARWPTKDV